MSKRYTRWVRVMYKLLILMCINMNASLKIAWVSQKIVWIIIQLKSEMQECMCRAVIFIWRIFPSPMSKNQRIYVVLFQHRIENDSVLTCQSAPWELPQKETAIGEQAPTAGNEGMIVLRRFGMTNLCGDTGQAYQGEWLRNAGMTGEWHIYEGIGGGHMEYAQLIDPFSQSEGFLKADFPHPVFLK